MTTPTITSYPGSIPAKGQSNTAFDTNIDAYLVWLSTLNIPELQVLAPWMATIRDEVAATAISGAVPDMTGKAGNLTRVNGAENSLQFRTPSQTLSDIGGASTGSVALKANTASPTLTGVPAAPTAAAATNTTQLATTAFVLANAPTVHVKAWVNFNGIGVGIPIRSSFNVSSITDNATGDFTVNFTTALANTNYITIGSCPSNQGSNNYQLQEKSANLIGSNNPLLKTTTQVRVQSAATNATVLSDQPHNYVQFLGT